MGRPMIAPLRQVLALTLAMTLAVPATASATMAPSISGGKSVVADRARGAAAPASDYMPAEVIVRFAPSASATKRSAAHGRAGARTVTPIGRRASGFQRVKLRAGTSVADAVDAYRRQPGVLSAQPNFIKRIEATPTDPYFGELWGMHNTGQGGGVVDADIDAPEAWSVSTGSQDATIAVIDTGVDYNHPDLAANVWTNPDEVAGNGLDDDHNGYVDDVHGWDSANDDGDPMDDHGHGTHVAGTIGAAANNGIGVVGVNWNTRIVAIKMLDASGSGTTADEIEAFDYADAIGAKVMNCSWGGYSTTIDAAEYATLAGLDALVVCAAGNEANDNDLVRDDTIGSNDGYHYPSSYDLANIVAVGASNRTDDVSDFSNYGATSVDLFAPGEAIRSTIPGLQLHNTSTAVYSDDMASLTGWFAYNLAGVSTHPWALTTARFTSAPYSVGSLDYASGTWEALEMNTGLNLGAIGAPGYALTFKTWFDVESDDHFWIWADSDQHQWTLVGHGAGSSGGFVTADLDLSDFAEDTDVRISFDLDSYSDDASPLNGEGVYVDDVKVVKKEYVTDYPSAYDTWDGTSMATPHVAGAAALLLAVEPELTVSEMRTALLSSVDAKAAFTGQCVTGGRLNLAKALSTARDGAKLAGTVSSGAVGLAGVTVSVGDESTTTGANGSYTLTGLRPGTRTVSFEKAHYGTVSQQATLVFGSTTTANVALARSSGAVAGTVTDSTTLAVLAGVEVSVAGATVSTEVDGTYAISGIAPGEYAITFSKEGYGDYSGQAVISSDDTATVDAALVPDPGAVTGVVRCDGKPLVGATVDCAGKSVVTGADGTYSIGRIVPGDYSASFSKVHYTGVTRQVTVSANATTTLDVELVANTGSVSGVVRSATLPLADVTVSIAGASTLTGPAGTYSISGLAPGIYSASFTKSGYATATSIVTVVSDENTSLDATLDLLVGSVSGLISDAGVAVSGALVTVGGVATVTGSDGIYAVSGLIPGSHLYSVSKSGYVAVAGITSVGASSVTGLNVALSRVVPKASIKKSPTKSSVTYRRKRGVAKYTLSATMTGWGKAALAKRTVYLQTSKNGKTGWKNTYKLKTNSSGKASKAFKVKTKGKRYYRWYVPAASRVNLKTYTGVQKVTVR